MQNTPGEVLVDNLLSFVALLRQEGLSISISEVLDAIAALFLLHGWSRDQVFFLLQSTLVKDPYGQEVFSRVFSSFFLQSPEKERQAQETREDPGEREHISQELRSAMGEGNGLIDGYVDTYRDLTPSRQKNLQAFLQGSLKGGERGRFLLSRIVQGSLEYWRRRLQEEEEEPLLFDGAATPEQDLLHRDMKELEGRDLEEMRRLVLELARRLSSSIKRKERTKRLDFPKTIRKNVGYGGLLLQLHYKKRLRRQPGIVLLSDVSGSMARYARFIIQFIYGLSSAVQDIRSFLFAEDLEEATYYFSPSADFSSTMAQLMEESQEWGQGTDIGQAIKTLREDYGELLSSKYFFLMVSDTRTIRLGEAVSEVKALQNSVKKILWLNPLPREEWEYNQGVSLFTPFCQMQECYQLHHLRKILYHQFL